MIDSSSTTVGFRLDNDSPSVTISLSEYNRMMFFEIRAKNLVSKSKRLCAAVSAENNVLTDETIEAVANFKAALDVLCGSIGG